MSKGPVPGGKPGMIEGRRSDTKMAVADKKRNLIRFGRSVGGWMPDKIGNGK